jgi:hypothetical protein
VGRLGLRRAPDHDLAARALAHIEEVEKLGGMAAAIEKGIPKMRIEEASARTQARIDSGEQALVGVNATAPNSDIEVDVLKVDNAEVRARQLAKLQQLKGTRDVAAVETALDALTAPRKGDGNLLEFAVRAARAKATVGEISLALEKAFGRHVAEVQTISGVYRKALGENATVDRVHDKVEAFARKTGREAAHPRRQDGPGRPRPRPEGHRHRLRRSRLRRHRRRDVPDAGGDRQTRRRARRAHRRRLVAGRRPPHADPRAQGRRCPGSAATTS